MIPSGERLVLVGRSMRAGTLKNDMVPDPFFGSGTAGIVAGHLMKRQVGIELKPEYVTMAGKRILERKKGIGTVSGSNGNF